MLWAYYKKIFVILDFFFENGCPIISAYPSKLHAKATWCVLLWKQDQKMVHDRESRLSKQLKTMQNRKKIVTKVMKNLNHKL